MTTTITSFEALVNVFYEYYGQGEYQQALDLLDTASERFLPFDPLIRCWQMAMQAKLGDVDAAVGTFDEMLQADYWILEGAVRGDPDFASLQGVPAFENLIKKSNQQREQGLAALQPALTILEPQNPTGGLLMVLHGHSSNAAGMAEHWRPALEQGWTIAAPQSSQATWLSGIYHWDDKDRAVAEVEQHYQSVAQHYQLDHQRLVIAGFSQGGEIATRVALKNPQWRGLIIVESVFPDNETLATLIRDGQNTVLRSYFIVGKDHSPDFNYFEFATEAAKVLKAASLESQFEVASNKFHGFADDFDQSLSRALDFITQIKD